MSGTVYAPGSAVARDANLAFSAAQTLPNNTNADSTNKIDLNGANAVFGGRPLLVDIDLPAHTVASAKTVTISVLECDTESGTYSQVCQFSWVATEALPANKKIGLFNPKRWLKINYATTDDLSAKKVTAYLTKIA